MKRAQGYFEFRRHNNYILTSISNNMKNKLGIFGRVGLLITSAFVSMFCLFELLVTAGTDVKDNYPLFIPGVGVLLILGLILIFYTLKKLIAVLS